MKRSFLILACMVCLVAFGGQVRASDLDPGYGDQIKVYYEGGLIIDYKLPEALETKNVVHSFDSIGFNELVPAFAPDATGTKPLMWGKPTVFWDGVPFNSPVSDIVGIAYTNEGTGFDYHLAFVSDPFDFTPSQLFEIWGIADLRQAYKNIYEPGYPYHLDDYLIQPFSGTFQSDPVPEPASLVLMAGFGAAGALAYLRGRRKKVA